MTEKKSFRLSLIWTLVWVGCAAVFNGGILYTSGLERALLFLSGYLVEMSLSIDNLFVMMLIFSFFKIPKKYQHRVLFWGVTSAFIMRMIFILTGVALIQRFNWMFYVFGLFLVITGLKTIKSTSNSTSLSDSRFLKWIEKKLPLHPHISSSKFWVKIGSSWKATPLFVALLLIEATDLVFAIDSIPAILGITSDSFIVISSNFFAILGLRSLYFVLDGLMEKFRYLNIALAFILCFVGIKMLLFKVIHIPNLLSLCIIFSALLLAGFASLIKKKVDVQ